MKSGDTHGPIDPGVVIGHVHLKVADLNRALAFYGGRAEISTDSAFGRQRCVSVSRRPSSSHRTKHLESLGGQPTALGTTGLYHLAIFYPTCTALADALRRVLTAGVDLDGASDPSAILKTWNY